jgi:hypothetical protein
MCSSSAIPSILNAWRSFNNSKTLPSLHALAEMVQVIHPELVHALVTFGDNGGNDMI